MATDSPVAEAAPGADAAVQALEIEGLSHAFGASRALIDVALAIQPSRFCVLLGLNGAGKTTLFSLITRLYNNTTGSIKVFGYDVRRQPSEALQRLGVVFQQRTLDLDLSIRQNLYYHGALHGLTRGAVRSRAEVELARVGLSEPSRRQGPQPVWRPGAPGRDRPRPAAPTASAVARRADRLGSISNRARTCLITFRPFAARRAWRCSGRPT